MGQDLGKVLACCQKAYKDLKLDIIIDKGVRFVKEGLATGGTIFMAVIASTRNSSPNPHQKENYVNPNQNVYRPGFHSITPKPIESHYDENSGRDKFQIQFVPQIDPNKEKINRNPVNQGQVMWGFAPPPP